ncbi:LytTR family DNA-binding domain-containing protein [uncultured Sphingobacterium sp.]|uniref:LytR/AlgR family response regulator transcription factor n=1 Tax=uncultured Sphingobacterium sp. TaxID=182688 RepID=UPI0025FB15F3|nr:LytTR family DNA-binding domain-containing protein [uncultured Sphingobacterium sp.]
MKIVIIEDETLMAKELARSLKRINPDIEILSCLSSVEDAKIFFNEENNIDLIFSDIELEDGLSFEIFKNMDLQVPVIFCTAYDEYAIDSFKANGVEYILKPFTDESLKKALDKFQWLKSSFQKMFVESQQKLSDEALGNYSQPQALMIHYRGRILPISIEKVMCVFIENDIVYVYTIKQDIYSISGTMDEMTLKLGDTFFRVNRQFLVNRDAIAEAIHIANRKLLIQFKFKFDRNVIVSKERTTKFFNWLSKQK